MLIKPPVDDPITPYKRITRDYNETVAERILSDDAYSDAILDELVELIKNNEKDVAAIILRGIVNSPLTSMRLKQFQSEAERCSWYNPQYNPQRIRAALVTAKKVKALKEQVRIAHLSGVDGFRRLYDTELLNALGVTDFADIEKE